MSEAGTRHNEETTTAPDASGSRTRLDSSPELCVLEVRGDLDIATSGSLRQELAELLELGLWRVDVDLSGVQFIDSSALNVLIQAHERAHQAGQIFCLRNPSPQCAKVLSITGLDHAFGLR